MNHEAQFGRIKPRFNMAALLNCMAVITPDYLSTQQTEAQSLGVPALRPSEQHGKVRMAFFYYKPTSAVAATKIINLCRIPYGARVIGGRVKSNALVASSTLDVGLCAADGSGVIDVAGTADSATLFTAAGTLAVATAGDYEFANTIANNYGFRLDKRDCFLIATLNTAGMDGSADILTGHVSYVVD